jgi:hypothetical protein
MIPYPSLPTAKTYSPKSSNGEDILTQYDIATPKLGFGIPQGWTYIVKTLVRDLIALGWDKDLVQVKQKFGGLRFYIGKSNETLDNVIQQAESACSSACYQCGEFAKETASVFDDKYCESCQVRNRPMVGSGPTEE